MTGSDRQPSLHRRLAGCRQPDLFRNCDLWKPGRGGSSASSSASRFDMPLFQGLAAFPITPADNRGHVDTDALGTLLRRLEQAGVDSIGLLGSTGTYAYLTRAERHRTIKAAVECIGGRVPLLVGVGALRTDDAQELARDAESAGADALLLAPVSYLPLNDEEVFQHFAAVAETSSLPHLHLQQPEHDALHLQRRFGGAPRRGAAHRRLEEPCSCARRGQGKCPRPPRTSAREFPDRLQRRLALGRGGPRGRRGLVQRDRRPSAATRPCPHARRPEGQTKQR